MATATAAELLARWCKGVLRTIGDGNCGYTVISMQVNDADIRDAFDLRLALLRWAQEARHAEVNALEAQEITTAQGRLFQGGLEPASSTLSRMRASQTPLHGSLWLTSADLWLTATWARKPVVVCSSQHTAGSLYGLADSSGPSGRRSSSHWAATQWDTLGWLCPQSANPSQLGQSSTGHRCRTSTPVLEPPL